MISSNSWYVKIINNSSLIYPLLNVLLEIWQKVKGWPKQPHIRKSKVRFSEV